MDRSKIAAIIAMLVILVAMTAVSGCTMGSMSVSPTPAPTAAPTAAPTVAPTAAPAATPAATTAPVETPTATPIPNKDLPAWMKPYPTLGPWTPGDDSYMPTPTEGPGYLLTMPWIDQKIRVVGAVVLTIKGNIDNPLELKMEDLNGYPQKTSTWINTKNASKSFTGTGPDLNALLDAAGIRSGATSIKLISSDGSTYTLPISAVRADTGAIVSLVGDGTLRSLIPTQSDGKAQLRGLVSIEVI